MKKLKELFMPAVVLCVICVVVTGLLAATNGMTRDTIANLKVQEETAARKAVLPEAASFTEVTGENPHYVGMDSDGMTPVGYVFITEEKGYGGMVRVMTGIAIDGEIGGVKILEQSETPGLGANCEKPEFTDQFKQIITGETGFALGGGDMGVDALTGATITSRAVTGAVNQAVDGFKKIQEEEAEVQ